jgi:uncharacterized protein (TIGR03067 family)
MTVLAVAVPDRPAPPSAEKPPSPQEMIYGDWQDMNTPGFIFRITPTETLFITNGTISAADGLTATYKIDWTKSPTAIDFVPKQRGGLMPGIFKIEGNKLTLALQTGGDKRPTDFQSGGTLILHYQRVKK